MAMKGGMVVIGAGECGGRAALALRDLGFDGPVTLVGEEPHLPYDRPPLSKQLLTREWNPGRTTLPLAASADASLNLPIASSQPCLLVLALVPVLACVAAAVARRPRLALNRA